MHQVPQKVFIVIQRGNLRESESMKNFSIISKKFIIKLKIISSSDSNAIQHIFRFSDRKNRTTCFINDITPNSSTYILKIKEEKKKLGGNIFISQTHYTLRQYRVGHTCHKLLMYIILKHSKINTRIEHRKRDKW